MKKELRFLRNGWADEKKGDYKLEDTKKSFRPVADAER